MPLPIKLLPRPLIVYKTIYCADEVRGGLVMLCSDRLHDLEQHYLTDTCQLGAWY